MNAYVYFTLFKPVNENVDYFCPLAMSIFTRLPLVPFPHPSLIDCQQLRDSFAPRFLQNVLQTFDYRPQIFELIAHPFPPLHCCRSKLSFCAHHIRSWTRAEIHCSHLLVFKRSRILAYSSVAAHSTACTEAHCHQN